MTGKEVYTDRYADSVSAGVVALQQMASQITISASQLSQQLTESITLSPDNSITEVVQDNDDISGDEDLFSQFGEIEQSNPAFHQKNDNFQNLAVYLEPMACSELHKKMYNLVPDIVATLSRNQRWPNLIVKSDLGERGRGVFMTIDRCTGEYLCDYKGEWRNHQDHLQLMENLKKSDPKNHRLVESYCMDVPVASGKKPVYSIDAHRDDGSFGRLINHSKKHPNVYSQLRTYKDEEGNCRFIVVFRPCHKIKKGEELLWDYRNFSGASWFDKCPCTRAECV